VHLLQDGSSLLLPEASAWLAFLQFVEAPVWR